MTCLWQAARVVRYHTEPQVGDRQSVADHSWGVAFIIARLHPAPSVALLKAALYHDLTEKWTGDTPAPAKWESARLTDSLLEIEQRISDARNLNTPLSPEEHQWLRAADLLELCLWCKHQAHLGNSHAMAIFQRGHGKLINNPLTPAPILKTLEVTTL